MVVLLVVTDAKAAQSTSAFSMSLVTSFPAPFDSRLISVVLVLEEPFLLFCLKVEELSHSKWLLWLLRPCALCHTHNAVLTLLEAIKRMLSLHRGAGQESKLIFLAYALCSGRQHTEMISLTCSLKYLYHCVSLL